MVGPGTDDDVGMATPRTILLGVDGSAASLHAAGFATDLASGLGARIVAVHAVGLLDVWPAQPDGLHERNSHVLVGELIAGPWTEPIRSAGVEVELVLRDGPPALVLLRVADEFDVDIIVVGTRGSGDAALFALGNTAAHLTERSTRPVLVVPDTRSEPVPGAGFEPA